MSGKRKEERGRISEAQFKAMVDDFVNDNKTPARDQDMIAIINYFIKQTGGPLYAEVQMESEFLNMARRAVALANNELLSPTPEIRAQADKEMRGLLSTLGLWFGGDNDQIPYKATRDVLRAILTMPSQITNRKRVSPQTLGYTALNNLLGLLFPDKIRADRPQAIKKYDNEQRAARQRQGLPRIRGAPEADSLFNSTQQLGMFANWAANNANSIQNRVSKYQYKIGSRLNIQSEGNAYYQGLRSLGQATWKDNKWQGPGVDKSLAAADRISSTLQQKIAQNGKILAKNTTSQQARNQIPPIVLQIVAANQSLSKVGFGPISEKGIALYAGRWLDPVTGNIRVLPNASKKYLNPISAPQKVAFSQARMINLWNQILYEYQQTLKWTDPVNQEKLQKRIQKQIVNGLNASYTDTATNNFINQQIKTYFTTPFEATYASSTTNALSTRNLIMSRMNQELLRKFYVTVPNFPPNTPTPENSTAFSSAKPLAGQNMASIQSKLKTTIFVSTGTQVMGDLLSYKLAWWNLAVINATSRLKRQISTQMGKSNNPANMRILGSMDDAAYYLTSFYEKRITSTLRLANKVETLPTQASDMKSILNATKAYSDTNQLLNNASNMTLTAQKKDMIRANGQNIRDYYKQSPLTLSTAGTLKSNLQPMKQLLQGLSKEQYSNYFTPRVKRAPYTNQYENRAKYRLGNDKVVPFRIGSKYMYAVGQEERTNADKNYQQNALFDIPVVVKTNADLVRLSRRENKEKGEESFVDELQKEGQVAQT